MERGKGRGGRPLTSVGGEFLAVGKNLEGRIALYPRVGADRLVDRAIHCGNLDNAMASKCIAQLPPGRAEALAVAAPRCVELDEVDTAVADLRISAGVRMAERQLPFLLRSRRQRQQRIGTMRFLSGREGGRHGGVKELTKDGAHQKDGSRHNGCPLIGYERRGEQERASNRSSGGICKAI